MAPSDNSTIEKELTILNKLGLHARPATKLAQLSSQFDASITLFVGDKQANAASVLGLMLLEGSHGKTVKVRSSGADAVAAMEAIETLISQKFNEEDQ